MKTFKLKKITQGYYKLSNNDFDVRVSKQYIDSSWNVEIQDLNNNDCLTDTHYETFKTKKQCVEFINYYLNNINEFI
jgi:hypothetical protein|tara:strand:+ start:78 stop:308 length:231 start_codon:yes stop_codon:yes gene_type:complete